MIQTAINQKRRSQLVKLKWKCTTMLTREKSWQPTTTRKPKRGSAHTHPLLTPIPSEKHPPGATNQHLIKRAKVGDPTFEDACDEATLEATHHHGEESLGMSRDEMHGPPAEHRSHPCCKLIFQSTPINAIRTKTQRNCGTNGCVTSPPL